MDLYDKHLTLSETASLPSASGWNTLGKAFTECYTRQRALDKQFIGKDLFAECTLSGTRQRLCRVLIWHSAKKSHREDERHHDGSFVECQGQVLGKGRLFAERRWLKHLAKVATLPSVLSATLGKVATFAECLDRGTRQTCDVYRVQWPLHSAKHVPR